MEFDSRFCSPARSNVVIGLAAVLFLVMAQRTDAHRPVTSKYDFNSDVFPLLRNHCARCHVQGGPAPMSLVTYADAAPWARAIRDELAAGRMPPWPVDPTSPEVRGGHSINARDIDKIVVWASGGTPEGSLETKLPSVSFSSQWKLGPPDLEISMEAEYTIAAGAIEQNYEIVLPTNVTSTKWVKAADLMPGNASIVRDAVIRIENNGPVLALWQPGGDAVAAPEGAAFRLAPGSKIRLQIHYKKHFDQELVAISDKSTVGLYFTDAPPRGRDLKSLAIDAPKAADPGGSLVFGVKLPEGARVVALRPMLDRAYESVRVEAITSSGTTLPVLNLQGPRPSWFQRYWLQEPLQIARGTEIRVRVTPLSDYSEEPRVSHRFPLQVFLDYVPQ